MLWGFVPELFSQTNGWREGDAHKRCLEGRARGKEPLEKGGQEWRGDLDGAHHERRTEAASLRHTERSGTPSTPAHRGVDEGLKPTKASLKPSIKARPRGYVPHHS